MVLSFSLTGKQSLTVNVLKEEKQNSDREIASMLRYRNRRLKKYQQSRPTDNHCIAGPTINDEPFKFH